MVKNRIITLIGFLSLILGAIGIFLPIMPTVPFVLLAAGCFSRSSPRFHRWIREHKYMGPVVRQYEAGQGLPRRVKVRAILLTWLGMIISMCIVQQWWATLLLSSIGTGTSIYLWRLPTYREAPEKELE